MLFFRCPGDDGVRLRHTAIAHHRTARLDDTGLGGGDVCKGGAKLLHMIHTQRRDDRTLGRVDDVGGVQRTAEAHFQHHDVAFFLSEPEHPQRSDDLKLGGHIAHGFRRRADALHQTHQSVIRDLLAVHLNALVEAIDEGGGVKPDPVSRRMKAGRQHGSGAALAIGARHMDEAELFVRVAQRRQQRAGAAQARLVAGPLDCVDVFQSGFVIHEKTPHLLVLFFGKRVFAPVRGIRAMLQ